MNEQIIPIEQLEDDRDRIESDLARLFPGQTAVACLRLDRLTALEARRAYDNRVKELHPGWNDSLSAEELASRERAYHDVTGAYCRVIAHLRQSGSFALTVESDDAPFEPAPEASANAAERPVLIAVAGSGEAVGTTTVAGTLAAALSAAGHPCLALDLNGAGWSLAGMLGGHSGGLAGLFDPDLPEAPEAGRTAFPRLRVLGGAGGAAELNLAGRVACRRLARTLRARGDRFAVLDLGRADRLGDLDLFASADLRLVVTTTAAESLAETHAFLERWVRALVERYAAVRLDSTGPDRGPFDEYLNSLAPDGGHRTPRWLLDRLIQENRLLCDEVRGLIRSRPVELVVNHHPRRGNTSAMLLLIAAAKNDLDVTIGEIHPVPEDRRLYAAERCPAAPLAGRVDTAAAKAVYRIAQKLLFPDAPDADRTILHRLRRTRDAMSGGGGSIRRDARAALRPSVPKGFPPR